MNEWKPDLVDDEKIFQVQMLEYKPLSTSCVSNVCHLN